MLLATATHRIHYDLVGPETGEVVCFAHALLADSGMWAEQASALVAAGYRVLRLDLRGHGGSDAPDGPCSVLDLARDVMAVLDHRAIARVHFVGLSIGGIVGQAVAIHHRDRLVSLAVSDSNAASVPNAAAMWAERTATVRQAGSTAPLAGGMMARLLTDGFKARNPARWQEIYATAAATRPEGVYACAQALQKFDFVNDLPGVATRTLVLCGANDPATPPGEAKKIAELIPNAAYREIPDALHFPNVEQPALYSEVLLGWVSGRL